MSAIFEPSTMKLCTMCKVAKPFESFYWTTGYGGKKVRHSRCVQCRRLQFAAWADSESGKEKKREARYRDAFKITAAEYETMHQAQAGLCAVCMLPESKVHRSGVAQRLAVDHDHHTGKVRGLLCSNCNVALGCFQDTPDRLRAAAAYLERHGVAAAGPGAYEPLPHYVTQRAQRVVRNATREPVVAAPSGDLFQGEEPWSR